jgi:hypothetical protein
LFYFPPTPCYTVGVGGFLFGDKMNFIFFFLGMLFYFLLMQFFKTFLIFHSFKLAEKNLLFISLSLLKYKYHAIELMNIVYDKAAENDETKAIEKIKVIEKIHEKFSQFGDEWIFNLKKTLPFETQYSNWKEAIDYADKLFSNKR